MELQITTTEMHTGGEPVRIVESGYPEPAGITILEKRADARARFDHLRTFLMHEPRGHRDMYGVIPVEPDHPDADLAVLFVHNAGYSTMCGHATLALGRYAVDRGIVERTEPVTIVRIQAPCGLLEARVDVDGDETGDVRFRSVGAFVYATRQTAKLGVQRPVTYDIAYGGAFYAVLAASELGVALDDPIAGITSTAAALTDHLRAGQPITHPIEPGLNGVYGTILTDGGEGSSTPSRNVCVFADGQVDRSPTGSGVTARMALLHARGEAGIDAEHVFESLTGHRMTGRIVGETRVGERAAVIVEVGGRAYYSGTATFTMELSDPLKYGFLLS